MTTIQHWINGSLTGGTGPRTAPVCNPATGQEQARVVLGGSSDVDTAVTAAARAFETWSESSLTRRTQVMFAFRQLLLDHEEELGLDAELFVIVEQDLYPCAPEVPLPIAVSTREHLAGCGPTGTRRPSTHE